jgi:hypothetical protein
MRAAGEPARSPPGGVVLAALLALLAPTFAERRADAGDSAAANALAQAKEMYGAFFRGDDETFGAYTHPKLLELVGGKAKFLAIMKKSRDDMRAAGWVLEAAPVSAPQQVVRAGGARVQAVLPTELVFRTPGHKVHQPSFLLGFSGDAGKSWKFIDVGRYPPDTLRKYFPECSPELKIPTQPRSYESRE